MPSLATSADLELYLGLSAIDSARADLIIGLAQGLCETISAPLSDAAKAVVLAVAARAYVNPSSQLSENVGGISDTFSPTGMGGVGGLFLSRADKAILRRIAGRGGAFSVGTLPKGVNAVQSVIIQGAPTGGMFTLAFGGVVSAPLALSAVAADVQAALVAVSGIGVGNVTVSGVAGSWLVTFTGNLGTSPMPELVGVGAFTGGSSPYVQVATVTAGVLAAGQGLAPWDYDYYGQSGINHTPGGFL